MKKYKSNSSVCHAFAHASSNDSGEANSIFFKNNIIYSYGYHFPIAKKLDNNILLFTLNSYSSTTSKHIYKVRSSCSHKEFLYTYDIKIPSNSMEVVENNIKELLLKLGKANKPSIYIDAINYQVSIITKLQKVFNFKVYKKDFPNLYEVIKKGSDYFSDELIDKVKSQIAKNKRAKLLAAKKLLKENQAIINDWRNFEKHNLPYSLNMGNNALLRYNKENDIIETSKNIKITTTEAKSIFKVWNVKPSLLNQKRILNNTYIIRKCTSNEIIIGCHTISYSEAKNIIDQITK